MCSFCEGGAAFACPCSAICVSTAWRPEAPGTPGLEATLAFPSCTYLGPSLISLSLCRPLFRQTQRCGPRTVVVKTKYSGIQLLIQHTSTCTCCAKCLPAHWGHSGEAASQSCVQGLARKEPRGGTQLPGLWVPLPAALAPSRSAPPQSRPENDHKAPGGPTPSALNTSQWDLEAGTWFLPGAQARAHGPAASGAERQPMRTSGRPRGGAGNGKGRGVVLRSRLRPRPAPAAERTGRWRSWR